MLMFRQVQQDTKGPVTECGCSISAARQDGAFPQFWGGPFHSLIETLKPLRMYSAKRQMFSRLYVNRIPTIIKEWKSGDSLAFMVSSSRTDADSNFFKRLCHGVWLFHLHSAVKIQPFPPVFPLAESTAKAFCRLSLWCFKEKASTIFIT